MLVCALRKLYKPTQTQLSVEVGYLKILFTSEKECGILYTKTYCLEGSESMSTSMGQIIKRLRKERGLTQEQLAQLLNLSAQSISKWENNSSMPDVSQIVPLATVLKVKTDVLFGMESCNNDEEVERIIRSARSFLKRPLT